MDSLHTPVFIAGAGPSGAAAALKLNALGIPCTLVDKATFPRDKICGDALSGKVMVNLKRIDPQLLEGFHAQKWKEGIWGIRFVGPKEQQIDIPFSIEYDPDKEIPPGFVARRTDFDNYLVEQIKKAEHVQLIEDCKVIRTVKEEDGFVIQCSQGRTFTTPLLLDASGAQSAFSRKYAGLTKREAHYAAGLRAYYKGVEGFHEHHFIELQFLDTIVPGYFWIFPLPNGHANVGIGLRSDYIRKKKVNLNKVLEELVSSHPDLKERFAHAELLGKVSGFGLPLGSKPRPISGDHYMVLGDAGHLVDPLTGEGIGNGIFSGVFAAEQAQKCIEQNNYSAAFLKAYDERVHRVIGKEMKLSYRLQQLMAQKWLVNFLVGIVTRNNHFKELISRMYTDIELRSRLVKPGFWLRLIFLKKF